MSTFPGRYLEGMVGTPDEPAPASTEEIDLSLNSPKLKGIRRLTALDTVRARIAMAVDLGLLSPGERLPPTDAIAQALDVGEITVRRALSSLCADGVLERRRGRKGGTLVAEQPTRKAVDAAEVYRGQAAEVHHLIDERLVMECGIAHLATRAATTADLDELHQLVEIMAKAESWAEFHSCDERFHLTLARTTGLAETVDTYATVLRRLYAYYLPYPLPALRESNDEHRALVEAMRAGDAALAADIACRHVRTLHNTMFVGLTDGRPDELTN
ncbi:FadR/GntR family transcriptional regulator [Streptomyces sp. NPDC088794]|uniref:FadR/GntR family transcriptional regulator n=1 Tax=Streptomyces sp. NPDC088794 TaxID=3365902 RepID=UPI0037FF9627